jgi:hypothetical protein
VFRHADLLNDGAGGEGLSDSRRIARYVALVGGCASTVLGGVALVYVLIGPFYHDSAVSSNGQRLPDHSHGLLAEGIDWPVAVLLALFVVLLVAIAVGGVCYFRSTGPAGAWLLRLATAGLTLAALVTLVTIGGLLAPAALLAVAASAAARPKRSPD